MAYRAPDLNKLIIILDYTKWQQIHHTYNQYKQDKTHYKL